MVFFNTHACVIIFYKMFTFTFCVLLFSGDKTMSCFSLIEEFRSLGVQETLQMSD